jgi:CRP/FNR family transcriptional regulator, dissimilatory nitrate respiration regulator
MNKPPPIDGQALLANIPLFRELPAQDLARITLHTRSVRLLRGEVLFNRGEDANGFYVIVYGQIRLLFVSARGNEKLVDVCGPGQSFGEAVMFMEHTHVVTAQAGADSLLMYIPRAVVFEELEREPRFARRMIAGLSQRLHYLMGEIESQSTRFGTQRVVAYLLTECPSTSPQQNTLVITLPMTKSAVASRLGLTREHFSRILHELSTESLIEVDGRSVKVKDAARLRHLSN